LQQSDAFKRSGRNASQRVTFKIFWGTVVALLFMVITGGNIMLVIRNRRNKTQLLNALLRGELAAVESYHHVLSELEIRKQADAVGIRRIAKEHSEMANALKHKISAGGGRPKKSSGRWGFCAKAVTMTAQILGKVAVLNALREGEELGLKTYRQAALNQNIDTEVKDLIESCLIPKTASHIPLLTRILEAEVSRAYNG
jgi:hypothetical protein